MADENAMIQESGYKYALILKNMSKNEQLREFIVCMCIKEILAEVVCDDTPPSAVMFSLVGRMGCAMEKMHHCDLPYHIMYDDAEGAKLIADIIKKVKINWPCNIYKFFIYPDVDVEELCRVFTDAIVVIDGYSKLIKLMDESCDKPNSEIIKDLDKLDHSKLFMLRYLYVDEEYFLEEDNTPKGVYYRSIINKFEYDKDVMRKFEKVSFNWSMPKQ